VALITAWGWRAPFFVFGFLGLTWAVIWFWYYRDTPDEHRSVNEAERSLIRANLPPSRGAKSHDVPWRAILSSPNLWVLSIMYFCYGYCLNVYLQWFPTYLNSHRGFDLKAMGFYASLPLLAGTAGDLLGGWVSDWLGRVTGNLRMARKLVAVTGFLIAAAFILPATFTDNPYNCVWYTCVAVFGLELTVGVSWAIPLDIGADFAGSVSAVMNTCGNIGGAVSPLVLAYLVKAYNWDRPFVVAAGLCVLGAFLFSRIDATKQILPRES
jgi:sugar phosphate permease